VARPDESRPSAAFSVLCPGAVPPLLEYPPTALRELSRKWDECQRLPRGTRGREEGGRERERELLRPCSIKETRDLSAGPRFFPCHDATRRRVSPDPSVSARCNVNIRLIKRRRVAEGEPREKMRLLQLTRHRECRNAPDVAANSELIVATHDRA